MYPTQAFTPSNAYARDSADHCTFMPTISEQDSYAVGW